MLFKIYTDPAFTWKIRSTKNRANRNSIKRGRFNNIRTKIIIVIQKNSKGYNRVCDTSVFNVPKTNKM